MALAEPGTAAKPSAATFRRTLEQLVEAILAVLDTIEGDPEAEEVEDDPGIADKDGATEQVDGEPSLGWTAGINQLGRSWHGKAPSLWGQPVIEDGEQEHDGRERQGDDEPEEQDDDRYLYLCDGRDPIDQRKLEQPA